MKSAWGSGEQQEKGFQKDKGVKGKGEFGD
jgi:hypothetical protein